MRSLSSRHFGQLVRSCVMAPIAVYAALMFSATAQTQTLAPPSIAADWTDYSAGDIAYLTGDNWSPGAFVTLQISEDGNPGHIATLYAVADDYGSVSAQYVVPGHGTAQNFTISATSVSGAQASSVFSNAANPAPFSWSTSDWTTAPPSGSPWIRTDRGDYKPGSTTLVAGGGWTPGDLVMLGFTQTSAAHLYPTVWLHAVADSTGAISAAFVLGARDLGASYEIDASSSADGTSARTTFTDSGFTIHSCALVTSGGAKCWGMNEFGTLGDNSTTERHSPVGVFGLTSGVVEVSTGTLHTCWLTITGGVKCAGDNSSGQLGDGDVTFTQKSAPVDVSGVTSGATFIGAGEAHSCAVTSGGGVKCWGANSAGQLGDGTTTTTPSAVDVFGLATGAVEVRAGGFHSCALTTSGGVLCWGLNVFGQLGDGSALITSATPVAVSGLSSDVVHIAAGVDHTCALTTSGGVKCWGFNGSGQLGNGTTTDSTTPVDVSGLTSGVVQIATGSFHTCAVMSGGGAKCWGDNGTGRLGDGTFIQRTSPVDVFGLTTGASQIYAGFEHTCALMTAGGIKCWGDNSFGQLGDGSITNHPTPANSGLASSVIALPEVKATTFTLTYLAGANGTISGVPAQIVYQGESGTAVTAVAAAGYHFVSWSDGLLTATRTDASVASNLTVTASFSPGPYTLTYTAGAHGNISGTSPQTVAHGSDGSSVTAVPDTGYHFVSWSDGVLTATRTDTNVIADVTVSASFAINTYSLKYLAGAHGSISGASSQTVNYGASGTAVTAVADAGYQFQSWSDGVTTATRTDSNVSGDLTVTASFTVGGFTLTYTAGAHGSIVGVSPQSVVSGGNGTPVTAVADTGYRFWKWSDGSTANPRIDQNVTGSKSVTAIFVIKRYRLIYHAGPNGSVCCNLWQFVKYGQSGAPVKAIPKHGYKFVKWSDGSTMNPRVDTNVTANINVTALFAHVPYKADGFFQPIDMPAPGNLNWNVVSAGQPVPGRWRLTQDGDPVSDPDSFLESPGGLYSSRVNCSTGASLSSVVEEHGAGYPALSYKGNGVWQFNWGTEWAYKNTCRIMFVKFSDGTVGPSAYFKFK